MSHRVALFPGSFDPFTLGHSALVEKGLMLFDEIIIGVGENSSKKSLFSVDQRVEMIRALYSDERRVKIERYSTLTVVFAQSIGAAFILRGVRSALDFEYERTIAEANRHISPVQTVVLFAESKLQHITSSIVRELIQYNQDVSEFLPSGMILLNPTK